MAGHSKWANIKHRKGRQDAKRGKIFTKIIRELTVAAKHGGPVPADNPRLRLAVDKALTANMSRDVIDRAIARGAGNNEADNVAELSYEGYGIPIKPCVIPFNEFVTRLPTPPASLDRVINPPYACNSM